MVQENQWRRCSACKQPIAFGATYWACNVSTCNRERTALAFCTVSCWEVHLPGANHRESWAVEKIAPRTAGAGANPGKPPSNPTGPMRRIPPSQAQTASGPPEEVLIVASRLKDYIRVRAGYSTSDRVLAPLSAIVRRICDEAIQNARRDGRMTVLDRDIPTS